jgi:uncharacterized membrane protein
MQSILLFGTVLVVGTVLWVVLLVLSIILGYISSVLGSIFGLLMGLFALIYTVVVVGAWILCMVKAYQSQYFKLPVIGNFAEKFSQK